MGEVRRRLRSWVQEHFPEAFALGNLSFLPGAAKVSVHMTKYMLHSRYTHIDEVAIDDIVSSSMVKKKKIAGSYPNF